MAEEQEGAGHEFAVETPIGKLSTKGYHLGNLLQILAVCVLTLLAYMMWEMRVEAKEASTAVKAVASTLSASTVAEKSDHDSLKRSIDKQAEAQEATTYVLTLNQNERERLRLAMPESLRRRHDRQ